MWGSKDKVIHLKRGKLYKVNHTKSYGNKTVHIGEILLCLEDKQKSTGYVKFLYKDQIINLYLCLPTTYDLEEIKYA